MTLFLLTLAGSAALLLWGVHLVQAGMQRALGARLRAFLSSALDHRLKAFVAGIAVTTALQSSTATGLMATGFVGAGLVALGPALAVMLGAHVGTTLIVYALAFPVAALVPTFAVVGFAMLRRCRGLARELGGVLLGLSVVLLALHHLIDTVAPHGQGPLVRLVLDQLSQQTTVVLIVAVLLTWAAHSSVAIVLVVMSLAAQGTVSLPTALVLVLGANLGTALNPLFEGVPRDNPTARRLPIGNLVIRVIGVATVLPLVGPVSAHMSQLETGLAYLVALFHTAFNLGVAALFLPVLTPYAGLRDRWMPPQADTIDPASPLYLTAPARDAPVIALGRATREALRLADALERMLLGLRQSLDQGEREQISQTQSLDDVLDRLNAAIKRYVMALDPAAMSPLDRSRAAQVLAFTTHLEQAGDLVDSRLLSLASKRVQRGLDFSTEGRTDLLGLVDRLRANVRRAAEVFMSADLRAARLLVEEKDAFREAVAAAVDSHFARLRSGRVSSIETSALHLDTLQVLKQVNGHLVEGAAYPLLEGQGALLPSRLRPEEKLDTVAGKQV